MSFHGPIVVVFARYRMRGNKKDEMKVKLMQTGELAMSKRQFGQVTALQATDTISNWIARMFGCWHREMSRPFSQKGRAYRVCLSCGAQRRFDLGNWKMRGNFYYCRPAPSH
jgi:hypothetical protein